MYMLSYILSFAMASSMQGKNNLTANLSVTKAQAQTL